MLAARCHIQVQSLLLRAEAAAQAAALEDAFAREREVRVAASHELNRELQRLRDELMVARRAAADQGFLVESLKLQLTKAADM